MCVDDTEDEELLDVVGENGSPSLHYDRPSSSDRTSSSQQRPSSSQQRPRQRKVSSRDIDVDQKRMRSKK